MGIKPERIKERRNKLGLDQTELARRAKTTQKQISKYERGLNQPKADSLADLAVALETTSDYLLGITDNPDKPLRDRTDLTDEERELILLFRQKSPDQRRFIVSTIRLL